MLATDAEMPRQTRASRGDHAVAIRAATRADPPKRRHGVTLLSADQILSSPSTLANYLRITQHAGPFEERPNYLLMGRVFTKRGSW